MNSRVDVPYRARNEFSKSNFGSVNSGLGSSEYRGTATMVERGVQRTYAVGHLAPTMVAVRRLDWHS